MSQPGANYLICYSPWTWLQVGKVPLWSGWMYASSTVDQNVALTRGVAYIITRHAVHLFWVHVQLNCMDSQMKLPPVYCYRQHRLRELIIDCCPPRFKSSVEAISENSPFHKLNSDQKAAIRKVHV